MSSDLLLNIGLAGCVLIFVVIGFVRGVQREIFTTAALLGGWAITSVWTSRWADWLAGTLRLSTHTAEAIVSGGVLVGCVVVLGWGGGSVLGGRPRRGGDRIAGALLGSVNGALLTSYLVTLYTLYLSKQTDRELIGSALLGRVFRDDYPYLLIAGMGLLLLLAIAALAIGGKDERPSMPQGRPYPSPTGTAVGYRSESDKMEPVAPAPHSYLESTIPAAPADSARISENGGRRHSTRFRTSTPEWTHISGNDLTAPLPVLTPEPEGRAICASCGEDVSVSDVYCPQCGKLTR